jgi:hypothetical protein
MKPTKFPFLDTGMRCHVCVDVRSSVMPVVNAERGFNFSYRNWFINNIAYNNVRGNTTTLLEKYQKKVSQQKQNNSYFPGIELLTKINTNSTNNMNIIKAIPLDATQFYTLHL